MRGLRERLEQDVVLGAEGYLFELERRGYLKSGPYVPEVVLEPTPDTLAELGRRRRPDQVLVGFAAETGDHLAGVTIRVEAGAPDSRPRHCWDGGRP